MKRAQNGRKYEVYTLSITASSLRSPESPQGSVIEPLLVPPCAEINTAEHEGMCFLGGST